MPFTSILKPDGSIMLGVATAAMVASVYGNELPDMATIHATDARDINVDAARRKATWTAAGLVSVVTLLTKDVNILVLGAVTLFAFDMHARHANASNKVTGELVADTGYDANLRSVS